MPVDELITESGVNARMPGPSKPRFMRKKPEQKQEIKLTGPQLELRTDADFCQQLLCDGFVQSYVDFYHLTHRADPFAPEGSNIKIDTSLEDMMILKDNLMKAEQCRRSGNTIGVYSAYNMLADLYIKKADWKTAIFFQEKCLEVSQLTTDKKAEVTAMHNLGHIYQKKGDYESARSLHEKQEELAMALDDKEELIRCNSELFKVYMHFASSIVNNDNDNDENGDITYLQEALELYQLSLVAAEQSEDDQGRATANGRIGDTYISMGKAQDGVPYLLEWSRLATELGDAEGRCMACSALALAYETLGRSEKALQELSMVSMISTQTGDAQLQSSANRSLGKLYSKVGNLPASVRALGDHFELLKVISAKQQEADAKASLLGSTNVNNDENKRATVTVSEIDMARALVGIAKGNLLFKGFCKSVITEPNSLLDWKLQREPIGNELEMINHQSSDTSVMNHQVPPSSGDAAAQEGLGDGEVKGEVEIAVAETDAPVTDIVETTSDLPDLTATSAETKEE